MKRILALITMIGVMFSADGMSSADLAAKAQYLGFDGDYVGQQDPLLSFDGNGNWFSGTLKSFTLTIANNTELNQEVIIFPGYMWNANQVNDYLTEVSLEGSTATSTVELQANINAETAEGTIKATKANLATWLLNALSLVPKKFADNSLIASDGIIFTDDKNCTVTCQGNPSQVRELTTYIMSHPTWLTSVKLRTDDPMQFSQSFKLTEKSPFKKPEEHTILLEKFTSNKDYQNTLIDIEIGMTINDLTRLSISVVAQSTLSITFLFGASVNMGKYLDYSASQASETAMLYKKEPVKIMPNISQK